MKYKICLLALLFLGLFVGMAPSAMAATTLRSVLVGDGVQSVSPGDSVVIAAFKVETVGGGAAAETIAKFTLAGSGNAAALNVKSLGIYWDVNQNATLEPAIDVLQVGAAPADVATWAGGGSVDLTLGTGFAIPGAAGIRYFLAVASVAKTASVATQATFDASTLITTVNTINSLTNAGTVSASGATDVVAVVATHLKWDPLAIKDLVGEGGVDVVMAGLVAGTTVIIEAVDDYGNRDLGINGTTQEVIITALKYADLTALAAVTALDGAGTGDADTAGDEKGYFVNGAVLYNTSGVTAILSITLAAAADNAVLVATNETGGLRGTISVEVEGAATELQGIEAARGIEVYDTDHNGKIDRATFFFKSPILADAADKATLADGSTAIPISAFSVVGYPIVSGSFAMINQDNGGIGVNNAGPFGVTVQLTEGATPDTGARPQVTYNANVAALDFQKAGTNAVTSIGPGDATEKDKARPILLTKQTVDANSDGFVDGIELTFSEPVTTSSTSVNPAKVAADPGSFTFALRTTDRNAAAIAESFTSSGGQVSVTNAGNVVTIPVSTAGIASKNTGLWPVLQYSQGDGTYKLTDSQLVEFLADPADNTTTDKAINIDDGVAAQVVTITTNDTDSNGKINKVAVEFTEDMDSSLWFNTGVTFDSGVATFGTAGIYSVSATERSGISLKVINFTIGESGTGVYDTEALPTFRFDQTGKLGDAHFLKAAKYGTGQVVPAIATIQIVDGAAPKIISATTGDVLTSTAGEILGASAGADGWIDKMTLVFSEAIKVGNKTSGYSEARGVVQGFTINLSGGGVTMTVPNTDAVDVTQNNIPDVDTTPLLTNPTLNVISTGDQSAAVEIYFDQAGPIAGRTGWYGVGRGYNNGDTGVKPDILYAAAASNFVTDMNGNTLENIAAGTVAEVDGAAPRLSILNPPETMDFNATVPVTGTTPSVDNGDGDGYIDSFKLYFTEQVKIADATNISGVKVFTSYNGQMPAAGIYVAGGPTGASDTDSADDRENAITMNIGVDANGDTDTTFPDVSTAPVITAADNATAANYLAAYTANTAPAFFFAQAVFYGTSAKRTTTGDTGMIPRIWYDGTSISDTTGVALAAIAVPTAVTVAPGVVLGQCVDKAKPVIMKALGIQDKNEINVQMSEAVTLGGVLIGTAVTPAQETRNVFGYEDVNVAGNASNGAGYMVYRDTNKSTLKLYTTANLTASDVANDLIWITGALQDEATVVAPNAAVVDADGVLQVTPQATIKIHIDDSVAPFVSKIESKDIDADGWVDYFLVTFSEPIKSSTIPGYVIDTIVSETMIDIAGYTGEKFCFFTTSAKAGAKNEDLPGAWAADGSTVYIKVDERSAGANASTLIGDTGAVPAITYTIPATLTDMEETPFAATGNAATVTDKAVPVIMTANQLSATSMEVTFSEDIDGATLAVRGFDWNLVSYPAYDGFDELEKFVTSCTEVNAGKATFVLPAAKALPAGVSQTIAYYTIVNGAAGDIFAVKDIAGNKAADFSGSHTTSSINVTLLGAAAVPTVSVLFPNGGETFTVGNVNIMWSSSNVTNVKIESSADGGDTWTTVVATVPATPAKYVWAATAGANVLIKVTDAAGTTNDRSDQAFTVNVAAVTPPAAKTLAVTAPNGGEGFATTASVNVLWTSANLAATDSVEVYTSLNGGDTWTLVAGSKTVGSAGKYVWTATVGNNQLVKVQLAADATVKDQSDQVFNVNTTATPPAAPAVAKAALTAVPATLPPINNMNVTRVKFSGAAAAADTIKVKLVDKAGVEAVVVVVASAQGYLEGQIDASPLANGMLTLKAGKAVGGAVATWQTFGDYLKETITIGAPVLATGAITDVPNDQGGFVNVNFTVSANHEGLNTSDWYVVDYYGLQVKRAKSATDTTKVWATVNTFKPAPLAADKIQRQVGVWVGTEAAALTDYRMFAHATPAGTAKVAADMPEGMFSPYSEVATGQAIDNLVPGAFTAVKADGAAGAGVLVTWTVPADHGVYNADWNIWGVDKYDVYRKVSGATGDFAVVGSVAPGVLTYTDNVTNSSTVYDYMVKAIDGSQITASAAVKAMASKGADFNGDGSVGLGDLGLLGKMWGLKSTDANFLVNYDLNKDNSIGLGDLGLLGKAWGSKVAKAAPAAGVAFNLTAQVNEATSMYYVNVSANDVADLNGMAFTLNYNANLFEFVRESVTGLGVVSIANEMKAGVIDIASVYENEKFNGTITLGFKSKGKNSDMNVEMVNAEVSINDVVGSVDGQAVTLKALPTVYALSQNFPNPFNPTTTIEYSVPTSGHTSLVVYNLAGQKVRTLVNETQAPSFYKVVWDGKNESGMTIATGTYFYKLVSGNYSKIVKMTLIK